MSDQDQSQATQVPYPPPEEGVYWIRSVTKDRYLDVAYERKEDGAQVIGQTLNEHATENQQWYIRKERGHNHPGSAQYTIQSMFDPDRYLTVANDKVVMNREAVKWTVTHASDYKVYRIAPANYGGNKLLSVINSSKPEDWDAVVASNEGVRYTGEAPKEHHQLWTFVKDPYSR